MLCVLLLPSEKNNGVKDNLTNVILDNLLQQKVGEFDAKIIGCDPQYLKPDRAMRQKPPVLPASGSYREAAKRP
jgi:hypothetical protein